MLGREHLRIEVHLENGILVTVEPSKPVRSCVHAGAQDHGLATMTMSSFTTYSLERGALLLCRLIAILMIMMSSRA